MLSPLTSLLDPLLYSVTYLVTKSWEEQQAAPDSALGKMKKEFTAWEGKGKR